MISVNEFNFSFTSLYRKDWTHKFCSHMNMFLLKLNMFVSESKYVNLGIYIYIYGFKTPKPMVFLRCFFWYYRCSSSEHVLTCVLNLRNLEHGFIAQLERRNLGQRGWAHGVSNNQHGS